MNKPLHILCGLLVIFMLYGCSEPAPETSNVSEPEEIELTGEATFTITGLPEGAKVITLSWFPGKKDDNFVGELYQYSDGMTIPAGKVLLLIEGEGYAPLMARRVPVHGDTVLTATMCKLDEGCSGTLTDVDGAKAGKPVKL